MKWFNHWWNSQIKSEMVKPREKWFHFETEYWPLNSQLNEPFYHNTFYFNNGVQTISVLHWLFTVDYTIPQHLTNCIYSVSFLYHLFHLQTTNVPFVFSLNFVSMCCIISGDHGPYISIANLASQGFRTLSPNLKFSCICSGKVQVNILLKHNNPN